MKSREPRTLIELLAAYPGLFYMNNRDWFKDESFMRVLPNEKTPVAPTKLAAIRDLASEAKRAPLAVDVANAYVLDPTNAVFDDYLLCRDRDALGQLVFVGGCANGKGFEIHRVLDYKTRLRRIVAW